MSVYWSNVSAMLHTNDVWFPLHTMSLCYELSAVLLVCCRS